MTNAHGGKAEPIPITTLGSNLQVHISGTGSHTLHSAVNRSWKWCLGDLDSEAMIVPFQCDEPDPELIAAHLQELTRQITLAAITTQIGNLLMFHAAGVANAQGEVLAMVAPSGTGKTTAARTLGKHYGYVSDETIGISLDGQVHPHQKPLSVVQGPGRSKVELPPDDLRRPEASELSIRALVLLERTEGVELTVTDIDPLEAMGRLAPETSSLSQLDQPLRTLRNLISNIGGVKLVQYAEASSLVAVASDLIGAAP